MHTETTETSNPQSVRNTASEKPAIQKKILAIGEDIHILNPQVQKILEEHNQQGLLKLAKAQKDGGAHSLDLNLGQGKTFFRQMKWVIQTLQAELDMPFFFSASALALPEILSIHTGKATINAVSATSKHLVQIMETALPFEANLVILLVKPGLMTAGVHDRVLIAAEVMETALATGFPLERIYLDPIFSTRPDPVSWKMSRGLPDIDTVVETIRYIKELSQGRCKTILSLSNGSLGMKAENRSSMHCRLLPILANAGLDAAIMNCRDTNLMETTRLLNAPEYAAA